MKIIIEQHQGLFIVADHVGDWNTRGLQPLETFYVKHTDDDKELNKLINKMATTKEQNNGKKSNEETGNNNESIFRRKGNKSH